MTPIGHFIFRRTLRSLIRSRWIPASPIRDHCYSTFNLDNRAILTHDYRGHAVEDNDVLRLAKTLRQTLEGWEPLDEEEFLIPDTTINTAFDE